MKEQEQYAAYLPQIRQRWLAEQASWTDRRQRAWHTARRIAALLRADFGAEQVIAFGSLTDSGPFDERSDIDLAVSGIAAADFFTAYAQAMLLSPEFKLDLLDLADYPPQLRADIVARGMEL
jgi:predicted nucleotidyltransferase